MAVENEDLQTQLTRVEGMLKRLLERPAIPVDTEVRSKLRDMQFRVERMESRRRADAYKYDKSDK